MVGGCGLTKARFGELSSRQGQSMEYGVNYIPSKNWYYFWQEFDGREVEADFCAIEQLGAKHIRLQLRWDLFQPSASFVSPVMHDRLRNILDIAERHDLQVYVTLFVGWLSGFWFLPPFARERHIIKDGEMIEAEQTLIRGLADIGAHKAFSGVDLGNEIDMYAWHYTRFDKTDGDIWYRTLAKTCEDTFGNKVVTLGVDHQPWLDGTFFSRQTLTSVGNAVSLHTWPCFTGAADFGYDSDVSVRLPQLMTELVKAYDDAVPIWIQEVGIPAGAGDAQRFLVPAAQHAKNAGVEKFTWWCSHDVDRKWTGFADMEYGLGLLDVDNKVKPAGKAFSQAVLDRHRTPYKPELAISIDDGKITLAHQCAFAKLSRNEAVTFIHVDRVNDAAYCARRGIKKIVSAEDALREA